MLLLLVMVAFPAVLLLLKSIVPKVALLMVALPAVLVLLKFMSFSLLMVALPAVLLLLKLRSPSLVMVALPPLMTMPAPLKVMADCWRTCRPRPRR